MIASPLWRLVTRLRIAVVVIGAVWRAGRERDGVLDYYRLADLIFEAWPAKGADGEPLPIRMPWYRRGA